MEKNRVNIIGAKISITNLEDVVEKIKNKLNSKQTEYICISNVHTTVTTVNDEYYRKIINVSYMSVPDGMPLSWVGRRRGFKKMCRTTGPDIMEEIFKISEKLNLKHYFYGSTKHTLELINRNLKEQYPNINIVGMKESVFRELTVEEDKELIKEINNLNPDIIWVGLGAPRQEKWMYEHGNSIKSSLMIGVGGTFNIYAGLIERAPIWIQKSGLEWFYRLTKEPKRLWKRYLVTNTLFIWYLLKNLITRKEYS